MTIHDEFLEILGVLAEDPQPPVKKAESDRSANASPDGANGKRKEAAS